MDYTADTDPHMNELARDVVTHLGEGWSLDPNTHGKGYPFIGLQGPAGARLRIESNAPRVVIDGIYPGEIGHLYRIDRHEISVSRSRGAEVIAREITRRLLPVYLPDLEKAQELVLRNAQNLAARLRLAQRIEALLPGSELRNRTSHQTDNEILLSIPGESRGTVRLENNGARAYLELRAVPADVLLRIVTVLSATA